MIARMTATREALKEMQVPRDKYWAAFAEVERWEQEWAETNRENQAKAREMLRERLAQLHEKLNRERAAREAAERERDEWRRKCDEFVRRLNECANEYEVMHARWRPIVEQYEARKT